MSKQTPQKPTAPHAPIPEDEGFFANRWRMIKAGAKSVYTYLTTPKTYLYAAAFAGVALGMNTFLAPGAGEAPNFIQRMFQHVEPGIGGAAAYAAKMITIGTMIHMGIDMFKEGHLKGTSPKKENAMQAAPSQAVEDPMSAAVEQAADLVAQSDPLQTLPSPVTPPMANNPHMPHNNQPDRYV